MSSSRDSFEEKVIQEGITLIKQLKQQSDGGKKTYVFIVQVDRLNTIEFIADFSESRNVVMKQPGRTETQEIGTQMMKDKSRDATVSQGKDSVKYIDIKALKQITIIQPKAREIIAELQLNDNWELKSKLKYIIKPAPKEKQRENIDLDDQNKIKDMKAVVPKINKLPLSLLTTGEALELLKANLQDLTRQISEAKPNSGQQQQQLSTFKFIDPEFLPVDSSVFGEKFDDSFMDSLIQWRRPKDFFKLINEKKINIFSSKISPLDIIPGQLGDFWVLSALATLAEKPQLIKRLFLTQDVNEQGYYRVKICKNGEWQTVSVDDFFPCNPLDGPIFSFAENQQLWVLILEKAYAKLHGNYFALKKGFCQNALMDFTGCPVQQIEFNSPDIIEEIWEILKDAYNKNYVMNIVPDQQDKQRDGKYDNDNESFGLQAGHAYAIIRVVEYNNFKLVNIRNIWEKFSWDGEWSNKSSQWDKKAMEAIQPTLGDPKQFWMTLENMQQYFRMLNICKVKNWDEVRVKGKFVRVEDMSDESLEVYLSKWYYQFEITEKLAKDKSDREIIITLHQEDEKIRGVEETRPNLDVSLAIFKLRDQKKKPQQTRPNENYNYELFHHTKFDVSTILPFKKDRQIEVTLKISEPGIYIILPRTNGLGFIDQKLLQQQYQDNGNRDRYSLPSLINRQKELTEICESVLVDIFRKFDMLLTRKLTYRQFKAFTDCISDGNQGDDFEDIINRYPSFELGLSQQGFLQYYKDKIARTEDSNRNNFLDMFKRIGYSENLYSTRSRCFILSIHSEKQLEVVVRDAVATDLDLKAHRHQFLKFDNDKNITIFEVNKVFVYYYYNKQLNFSSFFARNLSQCPIEVELNLSRASKKPKIFFSTGNGRVKKRVEIDQKTPQLEKVNIELLLHMKGQLEKDDLADILNCSNANNKYITVTELYD